MLSTYIFAVTVEPMDVEDAHARMHSECRGHGWDLRLVPVPLPSGRPAFCLATIRAPTVGAARFALDEALDGFEHGWLHFLGQGP